MLKFQGKTVTLKYKTVEFDIRTRAETVSYDVSTYEQIFAIAKELLEIEITKNGGRLKLRLMGVRLSSLDGPNSPTKRNVAESESLMKFVKAKDPKEPKELKNPKESKELRNPKEPKEMKNSKDPSTNAEIKQLLLIPKKVEEAPVEQKSFFRRKIAEFQEEQQKVGAEPVEQSFFRRKMAEFQIQKQQQQQKAKSEEPTETVVPLKRKRSGSISKIESTNKDLDLDDSTEISKQKLPTEEAPKRLQTDQHPDVLHDPKDKRLQREQPPDGRSLTRDAEASTPGEYFCPVCRWNVRCESLEAFNSHLDNCLSKQAIAEVLKEEIPKNAKTGSANTAVKLKVLNKLKKSGDDINRGITASNSKRMIRIDEFFVTK